eukprot:403359003
MVERKSFQSNSLRIEKLAIGDIKKEKDLNTRYRKEKHIGKGAFGDVYLVSRREYFAMKQYKEIPSEADLVELRLMQSIKSKYLCTLEDAFFSDQNEFMIVQQYAKHGDLLCYCRDILDWNIPENLAKEWLTQLTFGLKELHTRSVIHRDIKPENILVFGEDEVKLSDFGQAKIVENTLKTKQTITGTLQYMSVEMKMGQPYDNSTDIYSLGMTFIFMLTRKVPTLEEIMDPQWLPVIKDFSQGFIILLRKMISYRKDERPTVFDILDQECIQATKAFINHKQLKSRNDSDISLISTTSKQDCRICQATLCLQCQTIQAITLSGSEHGFRASKFHEICDQIPQTVIFILSEFGNVFGGFNQKLWGKTQRSKFDKDSFIFSLTYGTIHNPIKSKIAAYRQDKEKICIFGSNDVIDFEIVDQCDKQNSSALLGYIYQLPKGMKQNSQEAMRYLAGNQRFKVYELEVYSLQSIDV